MNIVKKIQNLILLVPLLMVLATVFVVSTELANGVVSGKYFWFYLSIGLVVFATGISFNINRKQIHFSFIDLLILLFLLAGCIVTYYYNKEITNKLILFILTIALYFYFKIAISQYKWATFIFIVFFITTGLIESIWGLKQLYGFAPSQHSLFKTTGSFYNSGPFGGYLAMVLPMAVYYLLDDYRIFKRKINRYYTPYYIRWGISLVASISILLVLPATMSRASWIAAICSCSIVCICYLLKQKKILKDIKQYLKQHRKTVFVFSVITAVAVLIALIGIYNLKKNSADGRALIWKISAQAIIEHPMGVGLGGFSNAYGEAQATYFASGKGTTQEQYVAGNPEYAFSEYLQIALEFGIVPSLIFVCIVISTLAFAVKRKQYAALGGLISILVFSSMSYPLNLLPFVIAFVFLLALCSDKKTSSKYRTKEVIRVNILLLSLLSIVYLCIYNRYPTYDAYNKWSRTRMLYNVNLNADASKEYAKLEPFLNHEIQFLFEYAQCLSKLEQYEESNSILRKAMRISCDPMLYNIMGKNNQAVQHYEEAEHNYIKASNLIPSRLYPYYLLAKLYNEKGDSDKACQTFKIMQTKEIKIHSPAIDEMRQEINEICNKQKKL